MGEATPRHNYTRHGGGSKLCEYYSRHTDFDKLVREDRDSWNGRSHPTLGIVTGREPITYSATLGARTEQNPYTAELAAMAMAMTQLPLHLVGRQITIISSNQGALLATSQPRHQSGQTSIERDLRNSFHTEKWRQFYLHDMDPVSGELRTKQESKGSSTASYRAGSNTAKAMSASQVHNHKQRHSESGNKDPARRSRKVVERH